MLAKEASDGSVVSFEPLPQNTKAIRENVASNGLANVLIRQVALSDKSGSATLSASDIDTGTGNASLVKESSAESVSVTTARGDSEIQRGTPAPDILKIDAEGAEMEVLKGLEQTLASGKVRVCLCEVHTTYDGVSVEVVTQELDRHGYNTEKIVSDGQPFVYASENK